MRKTVGLSDEGQKMMKELIENGSCFRQEIDAYRFAIALGLAHKAEFKPVKGNETKYNVGSLDPDNRISYAIKKLTNTDDDPYKLAEQLAEWGIREIYSEWKRGKLKITKYLEEARELTNIDVG